MIYVLITWKYGNSNNFVNIAEWNTPEDTKTEDQA